MKKHKTMRNMTEVQISDDVLTSKWALGWNDRGMGHGDWGIILEDTEELILGPLHYGHFAKHIVDLHNNSLLVVEAKP